MDIYDNTTTTRPPQNGAKLGTALKLNCQSTTRPQDTVTENRSAPQAMDYTQVPQGISPNSDGSAPTPVDESGEKRRGRERSRGSDGADGNVESNGVANGDGSGSTPSRKRRRSRKGLEKKYECHYTGCGRSYSRAEHLQRHKLNHEPKQIYRCEHPTCGKTFVRHDLRVRHQERHASKPTTIVKQTSVPSTPTAPMVPTSTVFAPNAAPPAIPVKREDSASFTSNIIKEETGPSPVIKQEMSPEVPIKEERPNKKRRVSQTTGLPQGAPLRRASYATEAPLKIEPSVTMASMDGQPYSAPIHGGFQTPLHGPPITTQIPPSTGIPVMPMQALPATNGFPVAPNPYPVIPVYSEAPSVPPYVTADLGSSINSITSNYTDPFYQDFMIQASTESPFSIFSNHATSFTSPRAQANHTLDFFISDGQSDSVSVGTAPDSPPLVERGDARMAINTVLDDGQDYSYSMSKGKYDTLMEELRDIKGVRNWMTVISYEKASDYTGLFFKHFYRQLPIIHRPTFDPEACNPMLLAIIVCMGFYTTLTGNTEEEKKLFADLTCLASGIRWGIYSSSYFEPPAQLWVFQALLLLEVFEKLYLTRKTHERAHIHHATTLILMKRGTVFLKYGNEANGAGDSPGSINGVRSGSQDAAELTKLKWWRRWAHQEACKRVAYAAFIIDVTHNAMFGHNTTLTTTDLEIPLPSQERIWEAKTAEEAYEIMEQSNATATGVEPSFVKSLKDTINNREVNTTIFGRLATITGLVCIANMVASSQMQNFHDKGRADMIEKLEKAMDRWRDSCDRYVSQETTSDAKDERQTNRRPAFYVLARLALQVDIAQLQILAGICNLLGRPVIEDNRKVAKNYFRNWVKTPKSRLAVCISARLLISALFLDGRCPKELQQRGGMLAPTDTVVYDIQTDFQMCRPWMLYYAALTIWAYGITKEGPIKQPHKGYSMTVEERVESMRNYLSMLNVKNPEDIDHIKGTNDCVGLLLHLMDTFRMSKWTLLNEASERLASCLTRLLKGWDANTSGQGATGGR